jgi:hypothetical protein
MHNLVHYVQDTIHSLWRTWHISAHAKADNSSLLVASLPKVVEGLGLTQNGSPSHNLSMGNKTWQLTMLLQMMKGLQTGTTTYIHNGPEGILVRS